MVKLSKLIIPECLDSDPSTAGHFGGRWKFAIVTAFGLMRVYAVLGHSKFVMVAGSSLIGVVFPRDNGARSFCCIHTSSMLKNKRKMIYE